MRCERVNGSFICIKEMYIGQDELIFGVIGVSDDILVRRAGFVIQELDIYLVGFFFQTLSGGGVGFDKLFVAACIERYLGCGVVIAVVRDHDVLFAAA